MVGNFDPPLASVKAGPAISGVVLTVSGTKPTVTWAVDAGRALPRRRCWWTARRWRFPSYRAARRTAAIPPALAGLNLAAGSHSFVIKATDSAGTPATTQCTGTFDVVGPTIKGVALSVAKGLLTWNAVSPNGMAGVALMIDNKSVSKIALRRRNYAGTMGLPGIGTTSTSSRPPTRPARA